jgi:hypothetical protein
MDGRWDNKLLNRLGLKFSFGIIINGHLIESVFSCDICRCVSCSDVIVFNEFFIGFVCLI